MLQFKKQSLKNKYIKINKPVYPVGGKTPQGGTIPSDFKSVIWLNILSGIHSKDKKGCKTVFSNYIVGYSVVILILRLLCLYCGMKWVHIHAGIIENSAFSVQLKGDTDIRTMRLSKQTNKQTKSIDLNLNRKYQYEPMMNFLKKRFFQFCSLKRLRNND